MTSADRLKWDERYAADPDWRRERQPPHPWLVGHTPRSSGGLALDLACGLGQNALFLARQGYRVTGVDLSHVGLTAGQDMARQAGLADQILFAQADLDQFRPPAARFELVCVLRFLSRDLFPWLARALKPGGRLVYATLNQGWARTRPEINPEFLLYPGELLTAFPGLDVLDQAEDDEMSYIACCKPAGRDILDSHD